MNSINATVTKNSYEPFLIPLSLGAGLGAVKIADLFRSTLHQNNIDGYVCGSGTNEDQICRFGSIGETAFPFCVEGIAWLQPLKSTFTLIGKTVFKMSDFPLSILGAPPKGVLSITLHAASEELFCRTLIQGVIIRGIQAKLLQKFSSEALIDHPISRITRIAASSIIFGLLHTGVWECDRGGTIPEIIAGVIFGALAETKFGFINSTLAHVAANLIIG